MGYGRDGLLLHHGRGAEQGAGGDEKDVAQPPRAHTAQDMTAQHRGAAPAARAAGVDVLSLAEYHDTAVVVARAQIDAFREQQIIQQPRAHPPQIACEHRVIVIRVRICRAKEPVYGVRRGRS